MKTVKELIREYKSRVETWTVYREVVEDAIHEGITTESEIMEDPVWNWTSEEFGRREAELRHTILGNLEEGKEKDDFVKFVKDNDLEYGHRMREFHKLTRRSARELLEKNIREQEQGIKELVQESIIHEENED